MAYWSFDEARKAQLISALTEGLAALRAKANLSQAGLAEAVGISRQTYNAIESGGKLMSWRTYLALLLYFDCNPGTSAMLRSLHIFPEELDNEEDIRSRQD